MIEVPANAPLFYAMFACSIFVFCLGYMTRKKCC